MRESTSNPSMPNSFANPAVTNPSISPNNNRITSAGWGYDAAGNTLTDAGAQTYVYDGENKMVKASNGGGTLGEYFYDGDGKRVKKIAANDGGTTIFVYDVAGKLVAEYSQTVASVEDAKVAYLTNDHLGSPRINTDRDGNVTSRHDYHPFGEEIVTTQRTGHSDYTPDSIRKQFTGYERDSETDLDFAQARMYAKSQGRFTTSDPIFLMNDRFGDPQRWNGYVYTRNCPIRFTDPTGLYTCRDDGKCESKQYKAFEAARQRALKSKDAKVREAAAALGNPTTDKNNEKKKDKDKDKVSVGFDPNAAASSTQLGTGADGNYVGTVTVTMASKQMSESDVAVAATVAHEGSHVRDFKKIIKEGYRSKMTLRNSEHNAFEVGRLAIETLTGYDPNDLSSRARGGQTKDEWYDKNRINKFLKQEEAIYGKDEILDSPIVDTSRIPKK